MTRQELQAAVDAVGAGGQRRTQQEVAEARAAREQLLATTTWADFYASWKEENTGLLADGSIRMYQQLASPGSTRACTWPALPVSAYCSIRPSSTRRASVNRQCSATTSSRVPPTSW